MLPRRIGPRVLNHIHTERKPTVDMFMLIDPLWVIREWHRPNVEKGAAWLDEYEPGWVKKIVPEELNLASTDLCICGQMFGCYGNRPEAVLEAHEYGFNYDENINYFFSNDEEEEDGNDAYFLETIQSMSFQALDRLWLDEVYWRSDYYGPPVPTTTTK